MRLGVTLPNHIPGQWVLRGPDICCSRKWYKQAVPTSESNFILKCNVQKSLGPKKIWVPKIFWPNKILVLENFGSKILRLCAPRFMYQPPLTPPTPWPPLVGQNSGNDVVSSPTTSGPLRPPLTPSGPSGPLCGHYGPQFNIIHFKCHTIVALIFSSWN